MLARPERPSCIECGLSYGDERFAFYHGLIEEGPAYWSDRGVLCSPRCALVHHRKRLEEGSVRQEPAPDPFEDEPARRR